MRHYLAFFIVCTLFTLDAWAAPSLKITPSSPIAGQFFQIEISDPSYPNGCAPREVFSLRGRPGNRIEMVALPTGDFCTQAITPYKLTVSTRINEPGIYILDYYLGFGVPSSKSISFTVRAGTTPDLSHTDGYQQGFDAGKAACLADPADCGISTNPVTYENGLLHLPEVHVIDPFGFITRFTVDFEYIPFSEPFSLKIKSFELLENDN